MRAKALILYSIRPADSSSGGPGMGMMFFEIADRDRGLIRKFIKEQITRGISDCSVQAGAETIPP
jgi:hypothetical protein